VKLGFIVFVIWRGPIFYLETENLREDPRWQESIISVFILIITSKVRLDLFRRLVFFMRTGLLFGEGKSERRFAITRKYYQCVHLNHHPKSAFRFASPFSVFNCFMGVMYRSQYYQCVHLVSVSV